MNVATETALIDSILAQIATDVLAHETVVAECKAARAAALETDKARVAARLAGWEPLC